MRKQQFISTLAVIQSITSTSRMLLTALIFCGAFVLSIVCIIVFASCAQKDQPQKDTLVNVKTMNVASSYGRTIDLMKKLPNVMGLAQYGGLHYEALHGDKEGLSSVKVNDQYREPSL